MTGFYAFGSDLAEEWAALLPASRRSGGRLARTGLVARRPAFSSLYWPSCRVPDARPGRTQSPRWGISRRRSPAFVPTVIVCTPSAAAPPRRRRNPTRIGRRPETIVTRCQVPIFAWRQPSE
jgi:hypothetical protein